MTQVNMYEPQRSLETPASTVQNRAMNEYDDEEDDEGEFDTSISPHDSAAEESETNDTSDDPTKRTKKGVKREADDAVTDEVDRPSFVPELSPRVIETVLQVNMELIRLCVEYQNRGWFQDPDYAIYQARLQSNLTYLASVADYHLKPDKASLPAPNVPHTQLAPIVVNKPTSLSERVNTMLAAARKAQEEQVQTWKTEIERQSRNAFDRLHQAERERAIHSSTASTPTRSGSHQNNDNNSNNNSNISGDLRKRKRVKEATKVTRVMDPQAGMGSFGSYQPVAPFVFGGTGMTLPGRLPGAPMVMGAATSTQLPISLQQQQQQQQQPSTLPLAAHNPIMGSHGLAINQLGNVNPALVNQQMAATAAGANAGVTPSAPLSSMEATSNNPAVASMGVTPQLAQLAVQLGIHPSAVAQLAASGAVPSADIFQLANLAMSSHTAAATTNTNTAALPKNVTGAVSDIATSTTNMLSSTITETINGSGNGHELQSVTDETNMLASHLQDSHSNSSQNSTNPTGLINLGNLETLAAANGLDPSTLGVLSPQALLSALGSTGENLAHNTTTNTTTTNASINNSNMSIYPNNLNNNGSMMATSSSTSSHNNVGGNI